MTDNTSVAQFVDDLNRKYEMLHTRKEDAFWTTYMGLSDDVKESQQLLNRYEGELKEFITDPTRLADVRERLAVAERENIDAGSDEMVALRGWERTFACHVIESAEAREIARELIDAEGELNRARGSFRTAYVDPTQGRQEASSVKLGMLISTDPDERVRRSAWEGLREVEHFVLGAGFLDIVRKRNRLGRLLGGDDYYDATVRRVEGMTKDEIFARLDELEERTRDAAQQSITTLRTTSSVTPITPWSIRFLTAGDVTNEQDPHFPFRRSIARWGASFAALGIEYQGAEMVLDLVDRKGKYENGFMHGPVPAWRDHGVHRKGRIHFTANAIPGAVGSGRRASETLFHEGGHAAHFANVDMPSPCFAQEFAPTSVGFSETQSMFLDSLLSDPDWQLRYAKTVAGEAMPRALIEKEIDATQPLAAWRARAMLAVCYAEKAIYEIPDEQLTPERVLAAIRDVERRLLFLDEGSPRPVLSVPHLLSGDSSAYYHGYVLAEMAVQQTRNYFLSRDGYLVDNAKIGPDLRESYWRDGNSRTFLEFVERLTGETLSAGALAAHATQTPEGAKKSANEAITRLADVPSYAGAVDLNARIRVMHGREEVARDDGGNFDAMADDFDRWIAQMEAK